MDGLRRMVAQKARALEEVTRIRRTRQYELRSIACQIFEAMAPIGGEPLAIVVLKPHRGTLTLQRDPGEPRLHLQYKRAILAEEMDADDNPGDFRVFEWSIYFDYVVREMYSDDGDYKLLAEMLSQIQEL